MTARYRETSANDSSPRYRIMIVQDDFLLRMETAADLRQWGYDVVEAFSEAEARRALHADRRIALVLLDVKVGKDQSGLELARWIGGHFRRPSCCSRRLSRRWPRESPFSTNPIGRSTFSSTLTRS